MAVNADPYPAQEQRIEKTRHVDAVGEFTLALADAMFTSAGDPTLP